MINSQSDDQLDQIKEDLEFLEEETENNSNMLTSTIVGVEPLTFRCSPLETFATWEEIKVKIFLLSYNCYSFCAACGEKCKIPTFESVKSHLESDLHKKEMKEKFQDTPGYNEKINSYPPGSVLFHPLDPITSDSTPFYLLKNLHFLFVNLNSEEDVPLLEKTLLEESPNIIFVTNINKVKGIDLRETLFKKQLNHVYPDQICTLLQDKIENGIEIFTDLKIKQNHATRMSAWDKIITTIITTNSNDRMALVGFILDLDELDSILNFKKELEQLELEDNPMFVIGFIKCQINTENLMKLIENNPNYSYLNNFSFLSAATNNDSSDKEYYVIPFARGDLTASKMFTKSITNYAFDFNSKLFINSFFIEIPINISFNIDFELDSKPNKIKIKKLELTETIDYLQQDPSFPLLSFNDHLKNKKYHISNFIITKKVEITDFLKYPCFVSSITNWEDYFDCNLSQLTAEEYQNLGTYLIKLVEVTHKKSYMDEETNHYIDLLLKTIQKFETKFEIISQRLIVSTIVSFCQFRLSPNFEIFQKKYIWEIIFKNIQISSDNGILINLSFIVNRQNFDIILNLLITPESLDPFNLGLKSLIDRLICLDTLSSRIEQMALIKYDNFSNELSQYFTSIIKLIKSADDKKMKKIKICLEFINKLQPSLDSLHKYFFENPNYDSDIISKFEKYILSSNLDFLTTNIEDILRVIALKITSDPTYEKQISILNITSFLIKHSFTFPQRTVNIIIEYINNISKTNKFNDNLKEVASFIFIDFTIQHGWEMTFNDMRKQDQGGLHSVNKNL